MHLLHEDLRRHIADRQVALIVGSGVSIGASGASPVASWRGLVLDGVARCEAVVRGLPARWADRVREEIESGDLDDLLSAAEKVSSKLKPSGGEYSRWLRETVGVLKVVDPSVISALRALNVPILTTNYDGLVEEVTGYPYATWREGARVERIIRGDEQGVVHLHGHWSDPASVVLGIRSYERLLGDAHAQAMLRALRSTRTLLFVGYGAGLSNPNLSSFLRWSRDVFAGSEFRHFRLALDRDVDRFQLEHALEERVFVLPYGHAHTELAGFLGALIAGSDEAQQASSKSICATAASRLHRRHLRLVFGRAPDDEVFQAELELRIHDPSCPEQVEILHDSSPVRGGFLSGAHIEEADIFVILVSASLLASEDLHGRQLRRVLERQREGRCAVVPILVRACDWREAPFAHLPLWPRDSRPITSHPDRNVAYNEVATELRRLIELGLSGLALEHDT